MIEMESPIERLGMTSTAARTGWVVLVVTAALGVVNHAVGVFVIASEDPEPLMFAAFTTTNAYALVVLLVPFRRREYWAWAVTWVNVAATGMVFIWLRDGVGISYLVGALVMAAALMATLPEFPRSTRATLPAGARDDR